MKTLQSMIIANDDENVAEFYIYMDKGSIPGFPATAMREHY